MNFSACLCDDVQHKDGTCWDGQIVESCSHKRGQFCQLKTDYERDKQYNRGYVYRAPRIQELQDQENEQEQKEVEDFEDD